MKDKLTFTSQQNAGWVSKTAIGWAAMGINVCVVNWEGLSKYLFNYFVVSQINTVRVANYIVQLIEFLESNGLDISETSLAGHSLGAQISGKVGAALIKRGKMLKSIYGEFFYLVLKLARSLLMNHIIS